MSIIFIDFHKVQHGGKAKWRTMTSYSALDSSQPKDSSDTKYLKIGRTVQALQAEIFVKF